MPEHVKHDTLVYHGGPAKALADGRVEGYFVRWGEPDDADLEGEHFAKSADLGIEEGDRVSLYYHHGQDPAIGRTKVGRGVVRFDDIGAWIEGQLDMAKEYASAVYQLAKRTINGRPALGFSSGAVAHLVQYEQTGKSTAIKSWPVGEVSLTPSPAEPRNAALPLKSVTAPTFAELSDLAEGGTEHTVNINVNVNDGATATVSDTAKTTPTPTTEETAMSEKDQTAEQAVPNEPNEAAKSYTEADVQAAATKAAEAAVEASMKAFREANEGKTVKGQTDAAPAVVPDASHWKYDNLEAGDIGVMIETLKSAGKHVSPGAYKALAMRLHADEGKAAKYSEARKAMKSVGLSATKADELNNSTLASYGDEWVGVAYSGQLWESIRNEAMLVQKFPTFEFPAGAESMVIPLEGADPTWYKVAQAADVASPDVGPAATVTSSRLGTSNQTMTLSKFGSRTLWTGEMQEDSVLPFVAQLRRQLAVSGAEMLESAIFDGDSATGATTNINDIAGTPGGSEYWLNFDGVRKLALVTNTANSRDGGVLASADFLATAKLMGAGGKNALDRSKVEIVIDPSTHYKALELADIKTQDVFSGATIEQGFLASIFGYNVNVSAHICGDDPNGASLSNSAGKIDQDTAGNNTKGQIIAFRPDQFRLGYRRRMTMETTRIARADAYEIVCFLRAGFQYRDSEAAAISYNITV